MAKLKVLKRNQVTMARLGIYSYKLTEPTNEFYTSPKAFCVLLILTLGMLSSELYFVQNLSSQVTGAMDAIKIAVAVIQNIGVHINMGVNLNKIKVLHLKLQEIVDESDEDAYAIYCANENKCEKYTTLIGYYVLVHTSAFTSTLIYTIYCFLAGNHDPRTWYTLFNMVVPFDSTTAWGWLLMWLIQITMAFTYATCMTTITSYFVSCCFYMVAMCDHCDLLVNSEHSSLDAGNAEKKRLKLLESLSEVVSFHTQIFEVFYMLADISSAGILALLPANAIFLSISLFVVEESTITFTPSALLFDLSCVVCALFWPFLMSYYATLATERIASIGDTAYESRWQHYPLDLQKYIVLIIARSQEQVFFTGMNMVRCTLEVFGKLFKTSCSYYLVFRTFARR